MWGTHVVYTLNLLSFPFAKVKLPSCRTWMRMGGRSTAPLIVNLDNGRSNYSASRHERFTRGEAPLIPIGVLVGPTALLGH
jgi:hypothetical protein